MGERKVYTANERYEAEMICGLLKENGIPAYYKGIGVGGYMDIYAGNSFNGEEIYVNEEQYDAAMSLLEQIQTAADVDGFSEDDEAEDGIGAQDIRKSKRAARIITWICVIILIAVIIWSLLDGVVPI